MSYDVLIGAGPRYQANYTSNIYPIWFEATGGGSLRDLNGLTAAAAALIIERVLVALRAGPDRYVALEPENKWGTLETFIPWLENLLAAAKAHPRARVSVSA